MLLNRSTSVSRFHFLKFSAIFPSCRLSGSGKRKPAISHVLATGTVTVFKPLDFTWCTFPLPPCWWYLWKNVLSTSSTLIITTNYYIRMYNDQHMFKKTMDITEAVIGWFSHVHFICYALLIYWMILIFTIALNTKNFIYYFGMTSNFAYFNLG